MTNVTVVFEYEEPEYCRLCLSEETKYNELTTIGEASNGDADGDKGIIAVIRELLKIELDPAKDKDAFICSTCVESLEEFHRYKSRCRQNNEALEKKANERKAKQIELAKSAIENTNVLDQVKDGEPIKVVIRMNTEGKASVRLQVQSKQQPAKTDAETSHTQPQPTLPVTQTIARKLIRLPKQEYYFYKTLSSNCGLIYGGYRYCASVPRKNGTHWICEQRRSHECLTLLYVDKSYNAFYLHSGHNHEPPLLRPNLHIYKAKDVLAKVIEKEEQIRVIRLTKKEHNHRECSDKELVEALSSTEMQIKDESDTDYSESDGEDEEFNSRDDLSDLSDSQMVSVEMLPEDEVKQERDLTPVPSPAPPSSHVKIDAGENTYIIQELT